MDRRVGDVAAATSRTLLALLLALALTGACGKSGTQAAPGTGRESTASTAAAGAGPARLLGGDGGLVAEPDAAPVAPADVLEGSAAEAAMTEALARDTGAGRTAPGPGEAPATGLAHDGVAGLRLGQARAEAVEHLQRLGPGVPLVRQPRATPDAPLAEEALVRGSGGAAWLRVRVYAGRVVELEVRARDGRALTDEGIGVGSSFDEAVLAHGDARGVEDEKTGRVRGWVLADLPGVLWVAAGAPVVGSAETAPPEGARIGRVLLLGPEALAPPD